jgi:hydrogenase expression/formation protein HypE
MGSSDQITLTHGEGGRAMRQFLRRTILPVVGNEILAEMGDAAILPQLDEHPVFTTDSFVVSPLFFPGGDIGSLAIYGTANDLAVAGAKPLWISLALILEEGFSLALLERILDSIAQAAHRAGVQIVTGDTKVAPRGTVDGLFITTSGVGERRYPMPGPRSLSPGDELLVSGPLGRHGLAVLAAREQLNFDPPLRSDCAPLFDAIEALRQAGIAVKAIRDATRGGVAAVLHEWAEACGKTMVIEGDKIPITEDVRGACELLGLDALHMACEGTMVVAVPSGSSDEALSALRRVPVSVGAVRIGLVSEQRLSPVVVRRVLGQLVPLDEPTGAPLPRIC